MNGFHARVRESLGAASRAGACLALLGLLILAAGCAKDNAVKLTYALGPQAGPCSGEVIVFKFSDKRPLTRLGTDRNGAALEPLSDVADWVGWALFDELKAAGCDPKYRTSSVVPGSAPLITGEVLATELNQTGATTWAARVSVSIMLQRDGAVIHSERFTSEVENVVVPGYSTRSDILAEALRGVTGEMVRSVCSRLGAGR
ncbi:hypothetical protein GKC30_06455 [Pseudodesulfovibrio sp. F-1]|uniref:ABC-type transport auxiliary lipoprotein component domain-containing protein n=1 Tax=Pseudodesulfovibrio alkaliphilus TaxID=2661613 RepID=A0A7K1KMF4_9BACT|nr:hypothetical protein [Pseudodesulfovibrio alkaliphilus]MUM77268.1 hypothetical protein [Pseudodesulfovibrio alkaliphilus]